MICHSTPKKEEHLAIWQIAGAKVGLKQLAEGVWIYRLGSHTHMNRG